jgi:hypothetical protein
VGPRDERLSAWLSVCGVAHTADKSACCVVRRRFAFVEGITSGTEDGTDSLPHLTNVKPDPEGPASKPAAGEAGWGCSLWCWRVHTVQPARDVFGAAGLGIVMCFDRR